MGMDLARMQGAIRQIARCLSALLPSSHIGGGLHSLATTVLLTECSISHVPSNVLSDSYRFSAVLHHAISALTAAIRVHTDALSLTNTVADAICWG